MIRTAKGKNHKEEEILKIYSENCPYCGEYMYYYEFLFNIVPIDEENEIDKIVRVQQIEELIEKVKRGEKMSINGLLLGCVYCYTKKSKQEIDKLVKKPYITLDAEDIFYINNTPISHVYLAEKMSK